MRPKVLLVDDEPQVTEALKRALHHEAYDIVTANSAAEALQILAREPADVVVADERMPGMSGSELLAHICRNYPDTTRIILTGHASLEAAVRAINEGQIYRFLTKPCNTGDLTYAIEQALQRKERSVDSRQPSEGVEHPSTLLRKLERDMPGITKVNRDANGAIILDDAGVDLETLIQAIKTAATKQQGRIGGAI